MHEGIYLFKSGVDPYSGGVFYQVRSTKPVLDKLRSRALSSLSLSQSPLYLSIFSTFLPLNQVTSPVTWTLVDAVSAYALVQTWRARSGVSKSKRDILLAALCVLQLSTKLEGLTSLFPSFLFNPYLFLPSLAFSTSSISNMLHLLSIMFAARSQSAHSPPPPIGSSFRFPSRNDITCALLPCSARTRFIIFHITGVTSNDAFTGPTGVQSRRP